VAPTQVAGQSRGRLGRWAVVLHRPGRPVPVRAEDRDQRADSAG
jgi:hypothetical protein